MDFSEKWKENWRNNLTSWQNKISWIYKNQILTDVEIHVHYDQKKKVFKAHKFVLLMSSEYFEPLFEPGKWDDDKNQISIKDVEPSAFERFLEFIYYKTVNFNSVKEAAELLDIADRFLIEDLKDLCEGYIGRTVNYSNVFDYLEFAQLHNCDKLEQICSEQIQMETKGILSKNNFENLTNQSISVILQQNFLNIKEIDLFRFVKSWIEHRTENGEALTKEEQRHLMQQFSFKSMTCKEFADGPAESGMMSENEVLSICLNMMSKDCQRPYPEGFSQTVRNTVRAQSIEFSFDSIGYISAMFYGYEIDFEVDKDITISGLKMWSREGSHGSVYKERVLIIFEDNTQCFQVIYRKLFEKEVTFSSAFSLNFDRKVKIRKDRRYSMVIGVGEYAYYKLTKDLDGKILKGPNITFKFFSNYDWLSRLPISTLIFEPK
ncbi:BTB/POZ domain-containing protein 2-like isoform X1 [Cimex lectularius]|uniref:BTB domain-containing protein n=1 Tax=Cimex lectularius TaxID=79782 RepID=A0A8I6R643_CIMLE|nr:BTB/POZ domain-containing protein 2-like isoform X1 [Cimex lectularius]